MTDHWWCGADGGVAGAEPSVLRVLLAAGRALAVAPGLSARVHAAASSSSHPSPQQHRPGRAPAASDDDDVLSRLGPLVLAPPLLSLQLHVPPCTDPQQAGRGAAGGGDVSVGLLWGCNTVAELWLRGGTLISLQAGGGQQPLSVTARVADVEIVDGAALCPQLRKVLRRKRRAAEEQQREPMLLLDFQGGAAKAAAGGSSAGPQQQGEDGGGDAEGPCVVLRASQWRFVYLQRVTLEVVNYGKDWLLPALAQPLSPRLLQPHDLLSQSQLHRLATTGHRPRRAAAAYQWRRGLPGPPPSSSSTHPPSSRPPLAVGSSSSSRMPFRLQILLLRSRVLLPERSASPQDSLVVDLQRFRLWRVPSASPAGQEAAMERFWRGDVLQPPPAVKQDHQHDDEGEEVEKEAGWPLDPGNGGHHVERRMRFVDPCNEAGQLLRVLLMDVEELRLRKRGLEEAASSARARLSKEKDRLDRLQARLEQHPLRPGQAPDKQQQQQQAADGKGFVSPTRMGEEVGGEGARGHAGDDGDG